jgi:hypothetical protein
MRMTLGCYVVTRTWKLELTACYLHECHMSIGFRKMVDQYLREHMRRKLTLEEAAIAKLHSTEELGRCLDELLQLHGGYGYMMEYPICRAFVDARVNRTGKLIKRRLRDRYWPQTNKADAKQGASRSRLYLRHSHAGGRPPATRRGGGATCKGMGVDMAPAPR